MKVTKPTPAPWKVDEETGIVYAEFSNGTEPAICHTQASDTATLPFDESIANARLIAAAPELLESCIEAENLIVDYIETIENNMDASLNYGKNVLARIRAAISKAKGES